MKNKKKRSFIINLFVLPFAIAMLLPLLIFDLCLSIYHRIAFAICKIKRVNRTTHFKVDQLKISQLNKIERFIYIYLFYARGVMSYATKIISETENYFCTPRPTRGRHQMMVDKSKMGVKELKAYQSSVKQKPKRSRKKK